jgi:nitrogen fixation-related uncharacterized protein
LFGFSACLYALCAGGHFYSSDAQQKFMVLTALLEKGTVAIDSGWVEGRSGLRYAWFPLGASLTMLPGYLVGRLLAAGMVWLPPHEVERLVISFQNTVFTAALLALVYLVARLSGFRARAALGSSLALGFGTMLWPYAKTSWSEPPATLALFLGLIALWWANSHNRSARESTWALLVAGWMLGMAMLIRQELALVLVGAGAWLWATRCGRQAISWPAWLAFALPISLTIGLHATYEQARYGAWLALPNFHLAAPRVPGGQGVLHLLENLYRFVLSPNQGLLVFSPAIALGVAGLGRWRRREPALAGLLAFSLLPLLGFYVIGWGPSSWSWGMRYTYVFLPFLMLPAAEVFEAPLRRWARVALGLGFVVQVLALPYDFVYLFQRELAATPGARIQVIMTEPGRGPLVLAVKALPELVTGSQSSWQPPRAGDPVIQALRQARAAMVPDFWWCLYRSIPLLRGILEGLAVMLALAVLGFGVRLAQAARADCGAGDASSTRPLAGV